MSIGKTIVVGDEIIDVPSWLQLPNSSHAGRIDIRSRKWVGGVAAKLQKLNPVDFKAKLVRQLFPRGGQWLNDSKHFDRAVKWVKRCHVLFTKGAFNFEDDSRSTVRKRVPGAGCKIRLPVIREKLFEWFVDVRERLRVRIPRFLFRMKANDLYRKYLEACDQNGDKAVKLAFSNSWIAGWMLQYRVSLRKPNKRFKLSFHDRKRRIVQFVANILRIRHFCVQNYNYDPPIISADQMPLHRLEGIDVKTMSMVGSPAAVREVTAHSRERCTVMTILSSEEGHHTDIPLEILFKGKGSRTNVVVPAGSGMFVRWQLKGSYRESNILEYIDRLPQLPYNRPSIHTMDDFSAHLTDDVRDRLVSRGYIPVILGGGITPDVQINDTHLHHRLKSEYRKAEAAILLSKATNNNARVPSLSRDDQLALLDSTWKSVREFDWVTAFKSLFLTNALNGSEDLLVSAGLWDAVGRELVRIRQEILLVRTHHRISWISNDHSCVRRAQHPGLPPP